MYLNPSVVDITQYTKDNRHDSIRRDTVGNQKISNWLLPRTVIASQHENQQLIGDIGAWLTISKVFKTEEGVGVVTEAQRWCDGHGVEDQCGTSGGHRVIEFLYLLLSYRA